MGASTCEALLNVKEDHSNPGKWGDGEFRMKVAVCPAAFLIFQILHTYCQHKMYEFKPIFTYTKYIHVQILLLLDLQKEECRNDFQLRCNAVAIDGGYWSRHIDATGAAYHLNEVIHIYIYHIHPPLEERV